MDPTSQVLFHLIPDSSLQVQLNKPFGCTLWTSTVSNSSSFGSCLFYSNLERSHRNFVEVDLDISYGFQTNTSWNICWSVHILLWYVLGHDPSSQLLSISLFQPLPTHVFYILLSLWLLWFPSSLLLWLPSSLYFYCGSYSLLSLLRHLVVDITKNII